MQKQPFSALFLLSLLRGETSNTERGFEQQEPQVLLLNVTCDVTGDLIWKWAAFYVEARMFRTCLQSVLAKPAQQGLKYMGSIGERSKKSVATGNCFFFLDTLLQKHTSKMDGF